MKNIFRLIVIFVFCIEYSLASEIVGADHFLTRNGLIYEVNNEKPFSGKVIKRYKNGQKKKELSYKDGKKEGITTDWYENGQKKAVYSYKDGKKDGHASVWYEKGQKKGEAHYKDGKREGLATDWHENGQKKAVYSYKDGKKDGHTSVWYEKGQKKGEANFKDGKLEGHTSVWYENGQKMGEVNFKDGKLEGITTEWYENGQKKGEAHYKDGKREGLATNWHENEQKKAVSDPAAYAPSIDKLFEVYGKKKVFRFLISYSKTVSIRHGSANFKLKSYPTEKEIQNINYGTVLMALNRINMSEKEFIQKANYALSKTRGNEIQQEKNRKKENKELALEVEKREEEHKRKIIARQEQQKQEEKRRADAKYFVENNRRGLSQNSSFGEPSISTGSSECLRAEKIFAQMIGNYNALPPNKQTYMAKQILAATAEDAKDKCRH